MNVLRAAGVVAGAILGFACTSFGLIDLSFGHLRLNHGNEWTPYVSGGGAVSGAVLGAAGIFRRHAFFFCLFGAGLVVAIAVRDRFLLQPPLVFLNLAGWPIVAAVAGAFLDRWRDRSDPSRSVVGRIALGAVLVTAVMVVAIRPADAGDECETRGGVTSCRLVPDS